jgi:dCTP deaminase
MLLSDQDLRLALTNGALGVTPIPTDSQIQPASIDLTLDLLAGILVPNMSTGPVGLRNPPPFRRAEPTRLRPSADDSLYFMLHPGEFALMSTMETVHIGSTLAARVEGRSTFGRMGLTAHVTAGFIDPGFRGTITLELANLGPWTVELHHGSRIAQLCVYTLSSESQRPYGHPDLKSKYQDQRETAPSRLEP